MTIPKKSFFRLTLGNVVYLLIFLSACFPCWAKYLYMIYRLVIGSLYPTYLSYKALKQRDEKECIRMIMYWIVFSIYSFFEGFLDIFLGFWLPFYYESKIIFIFWLISPYGNGARILYENLINRKLEEHEKVIDEFIDYIKQFSIDVLWSLWDKLSFHLNRLILLFITKGHMAAIHYIHNQYKTSIPMIDANDPLLENINQPLIDEPMDTENEPDSNTDVQPKKTLRKTKRKRKVVIEDISSNKPLTRSSKNKMTTSDTDNS